MRAACASRARTLASDAEAQRSARQPAAVGIGVAQLGEHRLRVPRDQLVQHRALGCASPVPGERLSGRAGRPFVEPPASTRPRCESSAPRSAARVIAMFHFPPRPDVRTMATRSARDARHGSILPMRIVELDAQVAVLMAQVATLTRQVAELAEKLRQNSRNSHLPPS